MLRSTGGIKYFKLGTAMQIILMMLLQAVLLPYLYAIFTDSKL